MHLNGWQRIGIVAADCFRLGYFLINDPLCIQSEPLRLVEVPIAQHLTDDIQIVHKDWEAAVDVEYAVKRSPQAEFLRFDGNRHEPCAIPMHALAPNVGLNDAQPHILVDVET